MSIFQLGLVAINYCLVVLLAIVFTQRRTFDIFAFSAASSMLYFFPMLLPTHAGQPSHKYYLVVLVSLLLAGLVFDSLSSKKQNDLDKVKFCVVERTKSCFGILRIAAFITILAFVFQVTEYGLNDLFLSKTVQSRSPYLVQIFNTTLVIGVVAAYAFKARLYLAFFIIFMVLAFLSGTRTAPVISMLACVMCHFWRNPVRPKMFFRPMMLCLFILIFVIGTNGKIIYNKVQTGVTSGEEPTAILLTVLGQIKISSSFHNLRISEPVHVDQMVNKIITTEYSVESNYLLDLPLQFLPFSGKLVDSLHFFSRSLKGTFYATWGEKTGVGASYWGEGIANFGAAGFLIFLLVYLAALFLLQFGLLKAPHWLLPLVFILSAYWGFYIHRNSLFQMISHSKKFIFLYLAISILLALLVHVCRSVAQSSMTKPLSAGNSS